ncbi:unnamed protein product [Caenorhabditis brenneri]
MSQYYSELQGAVGQQDGEEELLDFDRAMRDFQQMFPNIMASQIEHVLRKYDGDVSATINELLYDNSSSTPTSSNYLPPGEDILTRLRRRRHEINEKLRDNQKLLDKVTDVESARAYEDQQLALLLEHREVNTLISEEKSKKSYDSVPGTSRKQVILAKTSSKKTENVAKKIQKPREKSVCQRKSVEERVPDGPYVGNDEKPENFTSKIRETLKKGVYWVN